MKRDLPRLNYQAIAITTIASFIFTYFGDGADNSGMSFLLLILFPFGIAGVTILLYFLSRKITQKNNWIISLFGILLLLVYGLRIFFNI